MARKVILETHYTFTPSTKTISIPKTILRERLLLITNVTTNTIIYNFADPNTGGTITNNVLTLDYDTTLMNDSDSLQVFLDSLLTPASDEMLQSVQDQTELLGRVVKLLEPSSRANANGLQQVDLAASSANILQQQNITLIGAVSTNIQTAESVFNLQSRIAYIALRQQLEFS
jgi:hypothetical protein